jgi:hypothetical protein
MILRSGLLKLCDRHVLNPEAEATFSVHFVIPAAQAACISC